MHFSWNKRRISLSSIRLGFDTNNIEPSALFCFCFLVEKSRKQRERGRGFVGSRTLTSQKGSFGLV